MKKILKSQALWFTVIAVVLVTVVIIVRSYKPSPYIIGEVVEISSATARLDNFDENDGAYTADGDMLYIQFEPDGCEFFDEDGNACEATDITIGSKVKMTASTELKTDEYGYTTVYIKKVEVLEMAEDSETLNSTK